MEKTVRNGRIKKRSTVDKVFRTVCCIVMTLLSLSYVFMYVWLLMNSFRTTGEFLIDTFDLFDFGKMTLENYIIAKYNFRFKSFIYNVAVVSFIIPSVGSIATTYRLLLKMNLLNTYLGIFLMAAGGFGLGFLLFKNFFAAIPWDYAESAFLDGASDLGVFLRIMYPQAVPILVAIAITAFIGCWNDFNTAYIFMPKRPTISLGVNVLYSTMNKRLELPVALAGMTVLATVSLVVFAAFNKLIMSNFSAGGIKG